MSPFGFQVVLLLGGCASKVKAHWAHCGAALGKALTGSEPFVIIEILLKWDQSAFLDFHELFDRAAGESDRAR